VTEVDLKAWIKTKQLAGVLPTAVALRALLIAAWLCDVAKVREAGGNNRGYWPDTFALRGKSPVGSPWCALAVWYCLLEAGNRDGPRMPGRVAEWATWAKETGRLVRRPRRGNLAYWLNSNGTGHIGFVLKTLGPFVWTIEGNTNDGGSREGDRMLRKVRRLSAFDGWIRL
jgi:hypothetical protein